MRERSGFDVERNMEHLKEIVNKDDSLTLSSRFVKYLIEQTEQNQHCRNLLESLSVTDDIAKDIFKERPDKGIIYPNDLLQYILRKINDELERGTE